MEDPISITGAGLRKKGSACHSAAFQKFLKTLKKQGFDLDGHLADCERPLTTRAFERGRIRWSPRLFSRSLFVMERIVHIV